VIPGTGRFYEARSGWGWDAAARESHCSCESVVSREAADAFARILGRREREAARLGTADGSSAQTRVRGIPYPDVV